MGDAEAMTTWDAELREALAENGETWDDVESSTLTDDQRLREFSTGYGHVEGSAFTVWTKGYVYFPGCYDGSEWVECVPRHPNGIATCHIGGG